MLRIYSHSVTTAWGSVAVDLRATIPIHSIEAIDSVSTPAAKGSQFCIYVCIYNYEN